MQKLIAATDHHRSYLGEHVCFLLAMRMCREELWTAVDLSQDPRTIADCADQSIPAIWAIRFEPEFLELGFSEPPTGGQLRGFGQRVSRRCRWLDDVKVPRPARPGRHDVLESMTPKIYAKCYADRPITQATEIWVW